MYINDVIFFPSYFSKNKTKGSNQRQEFYSEKKNQQSIQKKNFPNII